MFLSDDELFISISLSQETSDRETFAREKLEHNKGIHILNRQSEISAKRFVSNTNLSSSSPLQIMEHRKSKVNTYRIPNNSNPEKKLYDGLHELDYVGSEILSDLKTRRSCQQKVT